MKAFLRRGFTLVELLVVISIMAILAAVLLANVANSQKISRDSQRKSDLRSLQTAIEAYRHKYGHYPDMGCTDTDSSGTKNGFGWSDEKTCQVYIVGLAPEFIPHLPHDPSIGSNPGYAYVTNVADSNYPTAGLVYKIMALWTVEADTLTYTHPFKSCDVTPNVYGQFQYDAANNIHNGNWCSNVTDIDGTNQGAVPRCKLNTPQNDDHGDGRFGKSYGLWGGYANEGVGKALNVAKTTAIICQ
jgi:prepilin-type N-terminal cleavage/methylation domain-containing protein